VLSVVGEATLQAPGESTPRLVKKGDTIVVGTRIVTGDGARVILTPLPGVNSIIAPGSDVVLERVALAPPAPLPPEGSATLDPMPPTSGPDLEPAVGGARAKTKPDKQAAEQAAEDSGQHTPAPAPHASPVVPARPAFLAEAPLPPTAASTPRPAPPPP
jgi:hypothetical protein